MVLEQLKNGASRQLQAYNDEGVRNLILILCLPLVDGVFATLLVGGAINTVSDVVSIALTIFTGAGALAVLYSYSESRTEARNMVLRAAPVLIAGALAVSLVAPVFETILSVEKMRYTAGLALATIAMKMQGVSIADKLSVPAIIITGLVLSLKSFESLSLSLRYVGPAVLTSLTASAGLYAASMIDSERLNLDHIRRGGSAVLGIIALSLFGLDLPSQLSLAVFAASFLASLR